LYQPAEESRTGAAVLICPGGGYALLAIDKEGHDVARWFAERGVCGVVLKNRLPRPEGHIYGPEAPLADARRALELLHERAEEWALDPARIGIMGFSAGGHLAATAAVHVEGEPAPAFALLIYPVISMRSGVTHGGSRNNLLGPEPSEELLARFSCEENVRDHTPATFLVHTSDDRVDVRNSIQFYMALQAHGVASELHIYDRGGHGYGLRQSELPVGQWPEALIRWMDVRGIRGAK
jgi:acetyl esterase/lipase